MSLGQVGTCPSSTNDAKDQPWVGVGSGKLTKEPSEDGLPAQLGQHCPGAQRRQQQWSRGNSDLQAEFGDSLESRIDEFILKGKNSSHVLNTYNMPAPVLNGVHSPPPPIEWQFYRWRN